MGDQVPRIATMGRVETAVKSGMTPAFYALQGTSLWREYLNLLHVPYTLWHLSYIVLGAAIASTVHVDRLIGTLLAFFLALGISAHTLDELNGRPLGTRIPSSILVGLAVLSLGGALALGAVAALTITAWIIPFMAFGGFIVVAYNLGFWHDRFHSDLWFAFAWGAFPALTSYWINSISLGLAAALLAGGCFTLSLAQRTLSTQVRTIRRKVISIDGSMRLEDGNVSQISASTLISTPEQALRLLSVTIVLLASSFLAYRLLT